MNYALIFAGGVGRRMNTVSLPKQFLKVHGKEIIVRTIEHFQNCDQIDGVVVVSVVDYIPLVERLIDTYHLSKVISVVPGGDCGQASIFNGLKELQLLSKDENDIVLIHDGVRPIMDEETIIKNIEGVKHNGTAITVSKSNETILVLEENEEIKDELIERHVI
jgi:2-C-methyl-D-erythritol 4-phosphate cytidylyltransferase